MIEWCVYCDEHGGKTFTNLDGEPWEAPVSGALLVGQRNVRHNWSCERGDWFVYRGDYKRWFGADIHGMIDHVKHFPREVLAVIEGRYVSDEMFDRIELMSRRDPNLPSTTRDRPSR